MFISTNTGARLSGEVWLPPLSKSTPYPAVILVTGANQQHRGLYRWASQGLAEAGFMVLTFDVQGQGDSENFNHSSDGSYCRTMSCLQDSSPPGVPRFDRKGDDVLFRNGLKDAIRFLFSTPADPYGTTAPNYSGTDLFNPRWLDLNRDQVAVAGHGLGATVAVNVGQVDQRIKAVVQWSATGPLEESGVPFAHAPMLLMDSDYGRFGTVPFLLMDSPSSKEEGFRQFVSLGIDVMQVSLRASTESEWTYAPGRAASRYGERIAFYYTLAWFDAYVRGISDDVIRSDGFARLTAVTYDSSADDHSIGTGRYEPDQETGVSRNVPYKIEGMSVCQRLSIYYRSMYQLKGGGLVEDDMRQAC